MAVRFYNRAKMTVAQAPNTGTFVLDEAAEGFQDFADAGVTHGVQIRYAAEQGNNWEFGTSTVSLVDGVYSIPRNPEKSSNLDNSAIIFDSNTEVFASMDAADVVQSIEDLIDVSSAAPNSGDFLRWDGGSWAPQFGSTTYTIQDGELSERNFTHALKGKLDDIEVQADVTDTANVVASLTAGANVTIASDGTISSTDTNTTYTAAELLTAVKTVDGAASGLDADLLDGQQGSYYTGYADTAVANIVDSSPDALNTLNELAAALGDDANFSTTVTNNIAEKLPLAGGTMTGALDMGSNNVTTTGKILYSNVYSAESDLPSASTYHGMFAHVHGTGKGYFAHGGNWIKLANYDDIGTSYTHPDHTGEVTSLADGATVIADNVVDEANLKVSNAPTNGYVLTAQSANAGGLTWAEASTGGGLGGGSSYANIAALSAATGMSAGDIALVTSSSKVYMYNGSGWFLLATLSNTSPTAITGVSGGYTLATDGTATVVTAVSSDPDGFPLTWSYAVTTGSLTNGGGTTATVSQADNVFTITPSTNDSYAGQFSITFSATDGGQSGTVSAVSNFTLSFGWSDASIQQTLAPSDGPTTLYSNNAYARVGSSVAIDGDTLVVGGVGFGGSAWVFTRSGTTWTEQQALYASQYDNGDNFGCSVDISGDTIIVGADRHPEDDGRPGSAFIFQRSGTTWTQEATLDIDSTIYAASGEAPADSARTDFVYFGRDVAIDGEDVIIGMQNYDLGTVSSQTTDIGGALIFRRIDNPNWSTSGTGQDDWTIRKKIIFSAGSDKAYARVGDYVDICNGVAAVSMNGWDGSFATPDAASNGGGIWIWTRDSNNTSWTSRGSIYPSDLQADDRVGRPDLDYSSGSYTLAVGVPNEDTGGTSAGAVYIFTSTNGTTWSQQQKIQASSTGASDYFGASVSVSGNSLVVGAYGDDDTVTNAGAIYIFERTGTTWTQSKKLQAPTPEGSSTFGRAVAMDGDYVVVGAKDNPLTATLSGASYVYAK